MIPIRTISSHRPLRTIALITALGVAFGCSDQTPDERGEGVVDPPETDSAGSMQAHVTDDPASGAASASSGAADYSGSLSGQGDVEVSADGQTWYTMGGQQEFTISLQDDAAVEMTEPVDLPADTYRRVRINFSGVEADLDAGSTVEGRTLENPVHLKLGDTGNAVMAQQVDGFELEVGSSARIVLDLNSERWVTAENLERRQIPKEQFEEQATIEIVGES